MLVVSGCVAKKEKSTITWTVNDLEEAHSIYCQDSKDCKDLGIKFYRKDRPTRENLPYKMDNEYLVFKSDEHHRIHMINVAKYYEHEQRFFDLLRFSLQYFKRIKVTFMRTIYEGTSSMLYSSSQRIKCMTKVQFCFH